jgi:hypothetical protein
VPSTFSGLVLFLISLAPGFVYSAARDARFPERTSTAFRETTRVVLASIGFDVVALGVFALVRTALPSATPDISRWIGTGWRYVRADYGVILLWAAVILLLAMGLALAAARVLPRRSRPLASESAWWLQFRLFPEEVGAAAVHVGCELVDGSHVSGTLRTFAHKSDETGDRELILVAPLRYRPAPSTPATTLSGHQLLSISARHIKFLTVTYLDHAPPPDEPPEVEQP